MTWCDHDLGYIYVFFFKQKTAYEMHISDWSSDVCSSDLEPRELVDRLLRAVARASQGAYAQPGQVRLGYAACAEGRSGGRRRLLRPSLALLGQADRKSVV